MSQLQRQEEEEPEENEEEAKPGPVQTKQADEPVVQRREEEEKPGRAKLLQRQEEEEELRNQPDEEETVRPKTNGSKSGSVSSAIESGIQALREGGQPLSESSRAFFEPRFGADLSSVRVHNDSNANHLARSVNAKAFTVGKDVIFGSGQYSPESSAGKKLMAHELTHVVQQGNGKANKGAETVRRYTYVAPGDQSADHWKHPSGEGMLVADRGKMAVENRVQHAKLAWADTGLITDSERILKTIKSKVQIEAGASTIKGKVPYNRKQSRTLNQVVLKNRVDGTPLKLTGDCAEACQEILGKPGEEQLVAMSRSSGGIEWYTKNYKYWQSDATGLNAMKWSAEIFKRKFGSGLTDQQAREKYDKLSPGEKKKFDKMYGINKFAVPNVGQGMTTVTENKMPGYVAGLHDWNFHFGTAILKDAHDYTTLESIAGRSDTDWFFWMYGHHTKKAPDNLSGQSFHQFNAIRGHGNKATTMVVEPSAWLDGTTKKPNALLVRIPSKWKTTIITKLPKGTKVRIMKKGAFWFKVTVVGGPHDAKVGWIMQKNVDQSY